MINRILQFVRRRFGLLVRYGIAGGIGAVIQTITLYVWISVLGLEEWYLFGAILGFAIALVTSFILQKYWTFRDRAAHRTKSQFLYYGSVAIINAFLNISLLAAAKFLFTFFGMDFFNGWYLIAQICIVCFASGVSFLINYSVTFKDVESLIDSNE